MLKRSLDLLQTFHNSYDEVKADAVSFAQVWGVSYECTRKRVSTVPRQMDEKAIDQRLTDPEHLDLLICVLQQHKYNHFTASTEI